MKAPFSHPDSRAASDKNISFVIITKLAGVKGAANLFPLELSLLFANFLKQSYLRRDANPVFF